jgi:hypothetical protein
MALVLAAGCGKKAEVAPPSPPSIVGKWVVAGERSGGLEIEFLADGSVIVPSARRGGTGQYRKLDEKRIRLDMAGNEPQVFEFALVGDELFLTPPKGETLRLRRGSASPEDKEKVERAIRNARSTMCANNLSQMWKMMNNYMVQYGGPQKQMPLETGARFWLKMSTPPTVLIDSTLGDIYICPFRERPWSPGVTDYRGPSGNVNRFADGDPVGACMGHHPGGEALILRKSGDVQPVQEGDSLYRSALEKTAP